jgi:hypothetical protein
MVLREFQDGGRIKLESRAQSVGSLKEDLSIDTTFTFTFLNLAGQSL